MAAYAYGKKTLPVTTVSREPGSGGRIVAQQLAAKLNMEVFHQEVLHEMAKRAEISKQMLATMDEKGLSILENWISSLVYDRHIWPGGGCGQGRQFYPPAGATIPGADYRPPENEDTECGPRL